MWRPRCRPGLAVSSQSSGFYSAVWYLMRAEEHLTTPLSPRQLVYSGKFSPHDTPQGHARLEYLDFGGILKFILTTFSPDAFSLFFNVRFVGS